MVVSSSTVGVGSTTNNNNNNNNNTNTITTLLKKKRKKGITTTTTTNTRIPKCLPFLFFIIILVVLMMIWFYYLIQTIQYNPYHTINHHHHDVYYSSSSLTKTKIKSSSLFDHENQDQIQQSQQQQQQIEDDNNAFFCSFRRYPPHRFYHYPFPNPNIQPNTTTTTTATKTIITNEIPSFLTYETDYVRGQWPIILRDHSNNDNNEKKNNHIKKICINQTEWLPTKIRNGQQQHEHELEQKTTTSDSSFFWPFADGTNPSIVTFYRLQKQLPKELIETIQLYYPTITYVVTSCMTNSQCSWKNPSNSPKLENEKEKKDMYFDLPDPLQSQPDTVRTILLFLNEKYEKIMETTIYLIRNSDWGPNNPPKKTKKKKQNQQQKIYTVDHPSLPELIPLDDARLFVYEHQLYVSYREGPTFGYENQVINPIHFTFLNTTSTATSTNNNNNNKNNYRNIQATIYTNETFTFCCGRNMALLVDENENEQQQQQQSKSSILRSVTWVDPVTVIEVNTTPIFGTSTSSSTSSRSSNWKHMIKNVLLPNPKPFVRNTMKEEIHQRHRQQQTKLQLQLRKQPQSITKRRLSSYETSKTSTRRRRMLLKEQAEKEKKKIKIKKSHIHGTNGFMVPVPNVRNEYIGIGHFHRPNDRNKNPYAKFGHHYTHVFYTIKLIATISPPTNETTTSAAGTTTTAYLTSLSNEFLLPSVSSSLSSSVTIDTNGDGIDDHNDDAHVIQFISGLEYNIDTNEMIIAYGINDCEGAITSIGYETIQQMLLPVDEVNSISFPSSSSSSSSYSQVVDFMQPLQQQQQQ